jgi:gliding motility-associated-like protein
VAAFTVENPESLCSGSLINFINESIVDFGEITKIEWYYDFVNNPDIVEVDESPGPRSAPKTYSHSYPVFHTSETQSYEVRMRAYSGASCVDETVQVITLKAMPEVEFAVLPSICSSEGPFQITEASEIHDLEGTGVFTGNGVMPDGQFDPVAAGPGTHTITYTFTTDDGGCEDSKSQDIEVFTSHVVESEVVDMLEGGEIVMPAIAPSSGLSYEWTPSAGLSATNILSPVAKPSINTVYTLNVTDIESGCTASGTVTVNVIQAPEIPNTFTPNGDGNNDFWEIKHLNSYKNCSVLVFGRGGQRVYQSIGYLTPWDGRFNGNELPVGVYYYIIDPKNGRKQVSGSITILR